ncbi:FecR domain-containing protein [Salinispirillum marinum]|uniref:FecR domain-containing protein n=2 Tax=Saccharospirillaceae TaxID=255527 RepID=A0ABV8BFZ9_9GAMM
MVTKFQKNSLACLIAATSLALTAHAQEKELAGTVLATRGDVNATDLVLLEERALARRSQVFNVDRVLTGAGAQTQLRMTDNALLSLTENSELVIAEYQFNPATGEGKVAMELISGGLRTITGLVSPASEGNEYELRTGAATIGIRGTTYEVRRVGGETFMAVWDGEIEIRVGSDTGPGFVLGGEQEFAYASVNEEGEVTFYATAPSVFADEEDDSEEETDESDEEESEEDESEEDSEEESSEEESDESDEGDSEDSDSEGSDGEGDGSEGSDAEGDGSEQGANDNSGDDGNDTGDNNSESGQGGTGQGGGQGGGQQNTPTTVTTAVGVDFSNTVNTPTRPVVVIPNPQLGLPTPPDVIAAKTGTVTYNNLLNFSIDQGFDYVMSLSFQVNFTEGTVNSGELILDSAGSDSYWRALFNGGIEGNIIQGGSLLNTQLEFNEAFHSNGSTEFDATGHITGTFHGNNAQQVRGGFSLTDSQETTVSGSYQVGQ